MKEQFWWGCESLDLESYPAPVYLPTQSLPMWLIEQCVDTIYCKNILNKDLQYIEELAKDIKINGMKNPIKLTIGTNGVTVNDGNHRFCAAKILKLEKIPTVIKISPEAIKQGGIDLTNLITLLLENLYE